MTFGTAAVITLVVLRVAIGWHFYKEGAKKFTDGKFSSAGFLKQAKGPLAPFFHGMLKEDSPESRLTFNEVTRESPELNRWEDYYKKMLASKKFSDADTAKAKQIFDGHKASAMELLLVNSSDITKYLNGQVFLEQRKEDPSILDLQYLQAWTTSQETFYRLPVKAWIDQLNEIRGSLESRLNELAIGIPTADGIEWLSSKKLFAEWNSYADRVADFYQFNSEQRNNASAVVKDYLGGEGKLSRWYDEQRPDLEVLITEGKNAPPDELKPHLARINRLASEYQNDLLQLVTKKQREANEVLSYRAPDRLFDIDFVDVFIPWLTISVGVLLLLGLFTRTASIAGAMFLFSVIATQPPWVYGTIPTYYQAVEMFALLVLAATSAGRVAGLDFFVQNLCGRCCKTKVATSPKISV